MFDKKLKTLQMDIYCFMYFLYKTMGRPTKYLVKISGYQLQRATMFA